MPAGVLLQLFCRYNPGITENIYSRGIYPVLARLIGPVFGCLPFSAAEALLALLLLFLLLGILFALRRGLRWLLNLALGLAAIICAGYFLFVVLWGLNYYREPLKQTLGYEAEAPAAAELSALTQSEVAAVDGLVPQMGFGGSGHSGYKGGFTAMKRQAAEGFEELRLNSIPAEGLIIAATPFPKSVFPSGILSDFGIEGIYIPFTFEPTVDTAYPDFILPFTMSHEASHLLGFAREDDANYIAYLACLNNPDIYFQYSGHMAALIYLSNALYSTDRQEWQKALSALDVHAVSDLERYSSFIKERESGLTSVANEVNNRYLQSQGQSGVASYSDFVLLLCGQARAQQQ